jgi:transcriptional regulator with XRE-family HTH domain
MGGMTKGKSAKTSKAVADSVAGSLGSLGDYLKEQRLASRLSLRQLADQVGVSNPYLSQIERGLRRPSAEVLQQLARALRISAEQLYVRAGIVHPDTDRAGSVELAILDDALLTERQKQSLLDVYASFLALNASAPAPTVVDALDEPEHDADSAPQY